MITEEEKQRICEYRPTLTCGNVKDAGYLKNRERTLVYNIKYHGVEPPSFLKGYDAGYKACIKDMKQNAE